MRKEDMKSDLAALEAMTDQEIDCSDLPEFTQEELDSAEWFIEGAGRETVLLSFERPVLDFFREKGNGWRENINAVLRDYVMAETKGI